MLFICSDTTCECPLLIPLLEKLGYSELVRGVWTWQAKTHQTEIWGQLETVQILKSAAGGKALLILVWFIRIHKIWCIIESRLSRKIKIISVKYVLLFQFEKYLSNHYRHMLIEKFNSIVMRTATSEFHCFQSFYYLFWYVSLNVILIMLLIDFYFRYLLAFFYRRRKFSFFTPLHTYIISPISCSAVISHLLLIPVFSLHY